MGKQVEFYMTPRDERDFLESQSRKHPICLLYNTFKEPKTQEMESLESVEANPFARNLSICNRSFHPRIISHWIPEQATYTLDLEQSELVQFSRCTMAPEWMKCGRCWFEESSDSIPKNADFIRWARSLVAWIRRHYHRTRDGRYIGPEAMRLEGAGRLNLGPPIEPVSDAERKRTLGLE